MRLAVIPARGGSKRIPRKNIKMFGGRPMVAWSIEVALESGLFDRIIVSTDDSEVAKVSREYGADVPFIRPPELADDYVGTVPVISHAVAWQNSQGERASEVCCIYATAPFLKTSDLQSGLDLLVESEADFVFSATKFAAPVQRAFRIRPDNRVEMLDSTQFNTRSQDLEEAWHDAAQFYWGREESWLAEMPLFGPHSVPLRLPRHRVQDIDTYEDWEHAELMLRAARLA